MFQILKFGCIRVENNSVNEMLIISIGTQTE